VKADLLTSMAILSGLVSADMPAKLVSGRKDIMMESAAYDIIKREGVVEGRKEGKHEEKIETVENLLALGILTDEQIARVTRLSLAEIIAFKKRSEK
jgi:predicted transposase YdaD